MHENQITDLRPVLSSESLPGSLGGLPRQAEGAEQGTTPTTGIDCLGRIFGVNDSVELIDGEVVRVIGFRADPAIPGGRFIYWDFRIPLGYVSLPCMVVRKA